MLKKILNIQNTVLAFGIAFLVYNLAVMVLGVPFVWSLFAKPQPVKAAEPQPVHVTAQQAAQLGINTPSSQWPTRIVISSVNLDLPLTGSIESQGKWNISDTGANFATNTAIPNGKTGNTALFGHDIDKIFYRLHNVKVGDEVLVYQGNSIFVYKITGTKVVSPTDVEVMNQTKDPTLTMLTCTGWMSENRWVVLAQYVKTQSISK